MSEFHDLVQHLVEVYERDVAAAREEEHPPGRELHEAAKTHFLAINSLQSPRLPGHDELRPGSSDLINSEFHREAALEVHDPEQLSNAEVKVPGQRSCPDIDPDPVVSPQFSSQALESILGGNLHIGIDNKSPVERIVTGTLESAVGIVISLNLILTLIQLQVRGTHIEACVESQMPVDLDDVDTTFFVLDHIFNAFFLLELILRVSILRGKFCRSALTTKVEWFNVFDCGIALFCSVDLYLTPLTIGGSTSVNLMFVRVLRLARLARTFKVIQMLRAFSKLRILLKTVASSVLSFTWSMVILAVFNLGGAIFICQMLQPVIADETLDLELRLWLLRYYGTSAKAVWTMFEFTFSGGWPAYARPVIEGVHWTYSIFFALYVSIVVFAIIRVITALFLKDTLSIASRDAEFMVQESIKAKREYAHKLKEVFQVADSSGDGRVTLHELQIICSIPEVIHYFKVLELDVSEVRALFDLLDDGDGSITYDEFVEGIIKLKGMARSMDVLAVLRECANISTRCTNLERLLSGVASARAAQSVAAPVLEGPSLGPAPPAACAGPTQPAAPGSRAL